MNSSRKAKVVRIFDGVLYHLRDMETGSICVYEIQPAPTNKGYYHLLQQLFETPVTYEPAKKGHKIKQETQKATIYLGEQLVSSLYRQEQVQQYCAKPPTYEKDEIIQCYVLGVQCLKLKLLILSEMKVLTFYFSELRLVKVEHTRPKQVWQKTEQYFRGELQGDFVQVIVGGVENYHDETNIYGGISRLHNGLDIREKAIQDGYAELSGNNEKYLTSYQSKKYSDMVQEAKKLKKGIWKQEVKISKGSNQVAEQKYNQWQQWSKNRTKITELKNSEQQTKLLISEFKKNSTARPDPNKCRIILETVLDLFEDSVSDKNIGMLEEFIKQVLGALVNLQTSISYNTDNLDWLKYLNKLLILVLFYVLENQKQGNKNKMMAIELDKIVKFVFRCCFIGNETFHEKVFDRRKESDFETFEFDPAYLSGMSSYSEYSESEEGDRQNKQSKLIKKITSAQTKIRINSTLVLSNIFKNYSSIVETHWQVCVKSNVLTKDFLTYMQRLKLSIEPSKMTIEQKRHIASLMRTNFGDHSLVLLIFFEHNAKVKLNALSCITHMIANFQSKKILDSIDAGYVEKLLNQTKSSFVPKSFIVFSALRNALYFMLFSLHHQRNVLIIISAFKALTELCQQSTLISTMGFIEGMGLLMSNYINPVLKFPWEIKELIELKCLCIEFMGVLVNSNKKWEEMESEYLMSAEDRNVNMCLLKVINENKQSRREQFTKVIDKIAKYFKNMAKRYYAAVFYEIVPGVSVWGCMADYYLQHPSTVYTEFIEQLFKCHFDQLALIKNQPAVPRKVIEAVNKAEAAFSEFLSEFIPVYCQIATNQNYINLINILTNVPYHKWSEPCYSLAKQFLVYLFESVDKQPQSTLYPSLQPLKSNSLVRLALIKLLGYISFCRQFQTPQFSTRAIRSLLEYSRQYKSPNTVTKITWGISNWSNIDCFRQGLAAGELKECLDYMIRLSQSQKEKIASNCTRGIGFFLAKMSKDVDLESCRAAVVKNLIHPIIKVRTNSTKTLRMMVANNLMWDIEKQNHKIQQLINVLEQNILKNNYHLQIQTLLLIKDLGDPIKQNRMVKIYSHILHDLLSYTTMQYQFSQIRALKQLRKVVLTEMTKFPKQMAGKEQVIRQFCQSVENFLLDSHEESLRKQAENSKILDRGFQKGEQALNAVFNIRKQKYDEEKTITTQFTMRGVQYEASQEDIELLGRIREVGKELIGSEFENQRLRLLSEIRIQGRNVCLGKPDTLS